MKSVRTVLITVVLVMVLLVVGFGMYAGSGSYNIGTDAPHWNLTYQALQFFRNRAIQHHAQSVKVPSDLDAPARLAEGAEHYSEMCTGCHLKPGESGDELREGLYPKPPDFSRMKHAPDPRIAFWVIKHGIKMTAMPAWGKSHSDQKIWDMVAFVRTLPGMTPAQYSAATAGASGDDDDHGHEDQDHDHAPAGHDHHHPAAASSAMMPPAAMGSAAMPAPPASTHSH